MSPALLQGVVESLRVGFGFLWVAAWAIIMGLTITSLVQVFVSKERMARVLGSESLSNLAKSTGFGVASSGCSFGAVAIGKGLFTKGAHPTNVLAFMFASTSLIIELGLMILLLLGWEFLAAEIFGGLTLILVMGAITHYTLPEDVFERAREELDAGDADQEAETDPTCGMEGSDEYTLVTDGGETLKFCSAGCQETYEQHLAGRGN